MEIFVLGTGRSGTHWVGHILQQHPDIRITIEKPKQFRIATEAAVDSSRRQSLLPQLREVYVGEIEESKPRHYADKSHPVMWYAETVAEWFPRAVFVGVERSPFGTIASMLRHAGVSKWQRNWRKYGVPNEFLGIDETNAGEYDSLDPAAQAALRWRSHHNRMQELQHSLEGRLLLLDYEDLIDNYEANLCRLWEFLGVPSILPENQRPKTTSRDAWRAHLSEAQIKMISTATGVAP